ncbi:MAG: hypothetical protein ABEJ81_04070 [Haloferacaceae archaeon]
MPVVPHYPSDDPDRDRNVPDIGDVVDRILNGDDDPRPAVAAR